MPRDETPRDGSEFKGTLVELRDLLQRIRVFRTDPRRPDVEGRRLLAAVDCSLTMFFRARGWNALADLSWLNESDGSTDGE